MMFAGHLPTKHFDLAEWQAMPCVAETNSGMMPDIPYKTPFYRTTIRGKPIVVFFDWDGFHGWAVRPLVRVPMQRCVAA